MFYLGLRQVVFVAWDRQEPIVPGAWNTLRWLFGAMPAGGAAVTLGRIVAVYYHSSTSYQVTKIFGASNFEPTMLPLKLQLSRQILNILARLLYRLLLTLPLLLPLFLKLLQLPLKLWDQN